MESVGTQDIIRSLGEFKSETSAALRELSTKVDGINRRLDVSNGRIAENEKAIQDLRIRESQLRVHLSMLQDSQRGRDALGRRYRVAMVERLLWFVAALALALVVRFLDL